MTSWVSTPPNLSSPETSETSGTPSSRSLVIRNGEPRARNVEMKNLMWLGSTMNPENRSRVLSPGLLVSFLFCLSEARLSCCSGLT